MINAWAVEILDIDPEGYKFVSIEDSENKAIEKASKFADLFCAKVIPLNDFDWNDAKTAFE